MRWYSGQQVMIRHSSHSEERSECRIRELPSLQALGQQAPHERQGQHGFLGSSHKQSKARECKSIRGEQQALRGELLVSHDIHDEQDVQRRLASCDRQLYDHLLPSRQALDEVEQLYGVQLWDKLRDRRVLRQVPHDGVYSDQERGALLPTLHLTESKPRDVLLIQLWVVAHKKCHGVQVQGLFGQYHIQSCECIRQDARPPIVTVFGAYVLEQDASGPYLTQIHLHTARLHVRI